MPQSSDNSVGKCAAFFSSAQFAACVIVLAVAAAYSNSFCGPFVFDDSPAIQRNPTIRSLWPISQVLKPPGEGFTVQGRPVINLSLAVNYALGGEAVAGYHVFNLAVHILAALLLFGVVRQTLLLPRQPQRPAGQSTGLALAIALLWGVHPLCTGAVTYVIQRAESLMALFYLLTLYCAIRSATAGRGGLWQTGAVLACLLGMGCKEVMVSAPLVVLLYDRVFLSRSFRECFRQRGLLYAGLAATWVLLGWLVVEAGGRSGTAGFGGDVAWWQYALTQCEAVVIYLKLCFWPRPLVLDYGSALITDPVSVWPQALLLASLLAAAVLAFRWQPWVGFLGVSLFAVLAPSSSVVPVVTQTMAEHRMYLPLAVVVALLVFLLHQGWELIWAGRQQSRRCWRWAPALLLAATAAVLGGATFCRNADYRLEWAIWNDTINKRPGNARAFYSRGSAYQRLGQFQEAIEDFTQAVTLKPDFFAAYGDRGVAHKSLGHFQEAIQDYTQVIAIKPDCVEAFYNRGNAYQSLGQFQEAIQDYTQAIALKPDHFDAYDNRANTYQSLGQFDRALQDYNRVIQMQPAFAPAYVNRAIAYHHLKQYDRAWADVAKAKELGGVPKADFLRALQEVSGRSQ